MPSRHMRQKRERLPLYLKVLSPEALDAAPDSTLTVKAALTITIPCHVGYNYLVGRVESMVLDMEKAALELTGFFERRRNAAGGKEK